MKAFVFLIIISFLFWSCKEEDLIPISGMSVSVPTVGLVDENGAEFSAEVRSFGIDPVLEYGFVYGVSDRPDISSDPKISQFGAPAQSFLLKAESDLIEGRNYFVAAFLKTGTTVYYSESVGFRSKGSKNFIFQNIISNEKVYFGDTITIEAANLKDFTEFLLKVKFEDVEVPIFGYSTNGFKFLIPREFTYRQTAFESGSFKLQVQIENLVYDLAIPLKFQEPVFGPVKLVEYEPEWTFTGDFLYSSRSILFYIDGGIEKQLAAEVIDDHTIKFEPNAFFFNKNPQFRIELRSQFYDVKQIEISDTDLVPGQDVTGRTPERKHILIVKNLNPFLSNVPKLLSSNPAIRINMAEESGNEIRFSYFPNDVFRDRQFEIYANNFGQKSANSAPARYDLPMLPIFGLPQELKSINEVYGITLLGKGYFFSDNSFYQLDPDGNGVINLLSIGGSSGEDGFLTTFSNKLYVSTFEIFPESNSNSFYEFDPVSNQLKSLSPVPSNGEVLGQFISNGNLYLDLRLMTSGAYQVRRLVYNFTNDTWSEIPFDPLPPFYSKYSAFRDGDELYAIGEGKIGAEQYEFGIFQWDGIIQGWKLLQRISSAAKLPRGTNVVVRGDLAYYQIESQIIQLDLRSGGVTNENSFASLRGKSLIEVNGKIYLIGSPDYPFLFEFDPEYM